MNMLEFVYKCKPYHYSCDVRDKIIRVKNEEMQLQWKTGTYLTISELGQKLIKLSHKTTILVEAKIKYN